MSAVRKNGLPAYQQIQGTIVKRLELGTLKAGGSWWTQSASWRGFTASA